MKMTAKMNETGDRATLSLSPQLWSVVIALFVAIFGGLVYAIESIVANERVLNSKISEDKAERMVDRQIGTVNKTLEKHDKQLDRIEDKIDRMQENR